MRQRKSVEWTRLDNASKIFPATCSNKDTKVFRLACELYNAVDPEMLQEALNITMDYFPFYKSVLRKGVFWYYFQTSDLHPVVERESDPVCAPIYLDDRKNLLFRVSYYHNRINLEIFHALSDGTGALWFMKTLVYHYIRLRHKEAFADQIPEFKPNASISEKMDDSFGRYFEGRDLDILKLMDNPNKAKTARTYRIRGTRLDENKVKVIEGSMSAKEALGLAHKYNATLTVFIAALFIYALHKERPVRTKNDPVVLSVPINLRNFFQSETTRNFFSTMNIGYPFGQESPDFQDVIRGVSEDFRKELTAESLNQRLNQLMSIEKNLLTRIIPLPFKDYSLRLASKIADRGITAAITNIGQILLPEEFKRYIRQFSLCSSARMPHISICSYNDRLAVSFSSPFRETEIQRTFFEFLSENGIDIEITCNL
ncbi:MULTISPECIES: hypothetical protein [Dehalobacter]|uniref:Alcohol acetyltransferase n=2 Tax=Dehalobacter restrictus TaxID=55583 RepID=A0A857DL41_9FIRM|nr:MULTISPECIES: hypothetical protein [Dehalobacter]AHF10811.1 hypothetical protein DEHRE_12640 [Dehalobacter restrictus DSM 9455]MCG1026664.1 hypothetical protein [Dehalobacter sp.]MDJ0307001.1 hypothetical protein [Dehalobacter sp.]OCZ54228.1 hypothetical protein A7D23_05505 [Dehalobacter sp. TeCB1]QHA01441.1 hypothetical protein GQ588_12725 [Dehalobacter restrictus]